MIPAPPVILLIDDEEAILTVFGAALEGLGYRVLTANNGVSGLEQARRHLPDLILSDVNMPEMDGKGLVRTLREEVGLATTQIILMTGHTRMTTAREAMELGADDFLQKPVPFEVLKSCVEARLKRAGIHRRVRESLLDEIRNGLRRGLPHEFFTPLAGVLGLADVLKTEWRSLDPGDVDEMLADISRSGWQLQRTLRNYLWMLDDSLLPPRVDGTNPRFISPTELTSLFRVQAGCVAERHKRESDLQLDIASAGLSGIDAAAVEIIISELLENAFAYSSNGSPVKVTWTPEGRLQVADSGRGIAPEQLATMEARQGLPAQGDPGGQGLGLGLALVQKLVRAEVVPLFRPRGSLFKLA